MKRTIGLILIAAVVLFGINFMKTAMPLIPIAGISMEPVLHTGDLISVREVLPTEIVVDDIIVFNVPRAIQDRYNYPPVVAHRVISISNTGALGFRTKGDNTGEDPFTVLATDLRGKVDKQYANLGIPFLFLQSQWGFIFAVTCLALIFLFTYSHEISQSRWWLQRQAFAPVLDDNRRTALTLESRLKGTEDGMASTQQALDKFAGAIELYAEHLRSHTSAIIGLSDASQELKKGAAEQNRILGLIADTIAHPGEGPRIPRSPAPPHQATEPAVKEPPAPSPVVRPLEPARLERPATLHPARPAVPHLERPAAPHPARPTVPPPAVRPTVPPPLHRPLTTPLVEAPDDARQRVMTPPPGCIKNRHLQPPPEERPYYRRRFGR
ncbi:MAG: signal peptidase I [Chloroflexota bacterium]